MYKLSRRDYLKDNGSLNDLKETRRRSKWKHNILNFIPVQLGTSFYNEKLSLLMLDIYQSSAGNFE